MLLTITYLSMMKNMKKDVTKFMKSKNPNNVSVLERISAAIFEDTSPTVLLWFVSN